MTPTTCPDHFVGAETLTCITCGYNAAAAGFTAAQVDSAQAWATLCARITFIHDEDGYANIYVDGVLAGSAETVEGTYGEVWVSHDLQGREVASEVCLIDVATALVTGEDSDEHCPCRDCAGPGRGY